MSPRVRSGGPRAGAVPGGPGQALAAAPAAWPHARLQFLIDPCRFLTRSGSAFLVGPTFVLEIDLWICIVLVRSQILCATLRFAVAYNEQELFSMKSLPKTWFRGPAWSPYGSSRGQGHAAWCPLPQSKRLGPRTPCLHRGGHLLSAALGELSGQGRQGRGRVWMG